MPSIRVNPKDGTHLSYGQVRAKWMEELRQARKDHPVAAAATPATTASTSDSQAGPSPIPAAAPIVPSSVASVPSTSVTEGQHQPHLSVQVQPESEASASSASINPSTSSYTSPSSNSIALSEDQNRIFREIKQGRNVFFTGPAGTGKSVLLRAIIAWARGRYERDEVAVTASTGIAGLNIGGSTIHSWACIGLGKGTQDELATRIKQKNGWRKRWRKTRILIIDEISMMDGSLFDKLDYIGRSVRGPGKEMSQPFGGIQLVLSGDFFQLPPVPDQSHNYKQIMTFAFDAKQWSTCVERTMFLQQVFRQTDNTFIELLSSIRIGNLTSNHIAILRRLQRPLATQEGIVPTRIYPMKYEVEGFNYKQLNQLPTPAHTFESTDSRGFGPDGTLIPEESAERLLDRMIALDKVTLKIGAQVMLIQNVSPELVNGSTGIVNEFLSVHAALERGITIAEPKNDKRDEPTRRPKSNEERSRDITQQIQIEWSTGLHQMNENKFTDPKQEWPLVRFTNGRELLCAPLAFSVESFRGEIEARRVQVPLILAWAMSIHKSQGQTLDMVKVDLSNVFEDGQAYVALSRARSMEGLEIENFHPGKFTVHPRVVAWYTLASPNEEHYDEEDDMDCEEAINSYWGSPE